MVVRDNPADIMPIVLCMCGDGRSDGGQRGSETDMGVSYLCIASADDRLTNDRRDVSLAQYAHSDVIVPWQFRTQLSLQKDGSYKRGWLNKYRCDVADYFVQSVECR